MIEWNYFYSTPLSRIYNCENLVCNISKDKTYPEMFVYTSTKDDRVHPGHARKMAKKFEAAGLPFLYYENIDGGHAAAANQTERAKRTALEFTYLSQKLAGAGKSN